MVEAARHVLLLCVLMSDDLPPSERVERFLEIFMNATLRESTAELVETCAARLERVVGAMFAGEADAPDIASDRVCQVFDFSLLKFKEKDELVECFPVWRASPDPERGVSAASAASRAARARASTPTRCATRACAGTTTTGTTTAGTWWTGTTTCAWTPRARA